ncbi:MAG: glycosyltransferase family 2 protein [Pyrodictiaceae archaeon]
MTTRYRNCSDEPEITVIVPTYNERENIPILLRKVRDSLSKCCSYEIIIVDDDSPDGTGVYAEELSKREYPELYVIIRKGERGLASAIIEGARNACGRYIVVMDADLQHPPEVIPRMYEAAKRLGADLVVASRYVAGGGVEGWSRIRLLMSKGASFLAHLLVPETKNVKDVVSGFFLIRRDFLLPRIEQLRPRGYKILLDIIGRLRPNKIIEVPYIFKRRRAGRSKLGLKTLMDYVLHLLELNQWRIVKNAIVGVSGIGVLWFILYLLSDILGLNVLVSYPLAIEASIVNNFIWNDLWVFSSRRSERGFYVRLAKYHGAVAIGALTNYTTFAILHVLASVEKYLASLLGILLGFLANYLFSEHVVWGYKKLQPTEGAKGPRAGILK